MWCLKDKLLLYLHLPKTGGSSFTQAIIENCPNIVHFHTIETAVELRGQLVTADALCGHFRYGIHQLTDRPYQYVTMLRHPVERTLSYFYFKYKNPEYEIFYDKDLTFEEYVLNPNYDLEYCNLQARMLLGEIANPYPNFKKVQAHLVKHFAFVGLTEQYDISLFLFMHKMNWKPKHYPKVNVTPNRPPAELSLSSEAIQAVLQKNEIDIKLYEHVCREFIDHVLELSSEQEQQLRAYLRAARN